MAAEESEADYGDEEDDWLRLRCKNRKPTPPVDPYPGTLCYFEARMKFPHRGGKPR